MGLKTYKPTTPTRRHTVIVDKTKLSNIEPEKALVKKIQKKAGRNNMGRITVRHKQAGSKRLYRMVDYRRDKKNIPAKVKTIEYDPNRTANIALLVYTDGEKRYILAPRQLKIGDTVVTGEKVEIKSGNCTLLKKIPTGMMVHNIELRKGSGGQLCRGAGTAAQIQGISGKYAQLKMPSGEIRLVNSENYATIGEVGNEEYSNRKLGKAGRKRGMGWRPSVRGMAMGASVHPHGGGEGKGQVGGQSKDLWGNRRGLKTRKNKRTNKFILKGRVTKRKK